jgi:hypothetical protein
MFQMLPESSGRLVAVRVTGKLTKEDMVSVAPPVEEKIRENGKVDLLCDMTDLHGWSLGGFWAELKFDAKHAKTSDESQSSRANHFIGSWRQC